MTVNEVLRELRGDYAASSQAQECAARLIESQAAQIEALTKDAADAEQVTDSVECACGRLHTKKAAGWYVTTVSGALMATSIDSAIKAKEEK